MSNWYILEGKTPVFEPNTLTAGRFFESIDNMIVARTTVDDVLVSTIFLGIDHNFGDGPPLLFETMIFGGTEDSYQERCSTWEEAEEQHKKACAVAFCGIGKK